MDDTKKMLRAIINGQSAIKSELLTKIGVLEKKITDLGKKLDTNDNNLKAELNSVEKRLTKRIDMIGTQVAVLDDDAPSGEDFDKLIERVDDIELRLQAMI